MDPQGDTSNLPYPVRIVAMVNVTASIILIIAILLGHILYSLNGPLRIQGPPKHWARPLVLSSVIFAHVFLQVLTLSSAVPNDFIFGFIAEDTIDESCSLVRFFLASEVARNWSLVVLSMYTLFTVYKSSALSGTRQLVSWIITCILVWIMSVSSTFFVLTEHEQYSGTTCSIKVETDLFTTFHKYVPSSCISFLTLLILARGGRCTRACRQCFKQSRSHERSEHGKWVKDQRRTTLVFHVITSVCFIPVSFVGYQALDIFYYWLFLLSALLLKDVRELIFTFICYIFCSWCSRHSAGQDDKKSKDEEMANVKRQNGTQGMGSKELEEENKHSCAVTADIASDDSDSKLEHTNEQKASTNSKKRTQKKPRIGLKSKGTFNEIRKIMKKQKRKKNKRKKSHDSTSDSSADEQEPTDTDSEDEKSSDEAQNSDGSVSFDDD